VAHGRLTAGQLAELREIVMTARVHPAGYNESPAVVGTMGAPKLQKGAHRELNILGPLDAPGAQEVWLAGIQSVLAREIHSGVKHFNAVRWAQPSGQDA